ncbi:hypothetical protein F383_33552 [Gossypium arboreum]|uniref:Uncharacterized protein n=1 Tax=Gossypium arboreum TaxID=29729 RepID=A0A0B0N7M7_GOSAR|nr:hypothetical protein F383_33552 [Gossypium arboreum]
MCCKKGFRPDG